MLMAKRNGFVQLKRIFGHIHWVNNSNCCAGAQPAAPEAWCQGTSLPHVLPLKKKKKSGINHLAVSVPRNLLEQIVTWYTPIGYSLDQQATSRIGVSSANPCPTSVQFESWEMMVSSLPQSSSRLSGAEVVQKYFSVYTDALHSWEQK